MPITGQPSAGQVHHLADLLGEDLGQRPAEDGEVLGKDELFRPKIVPVLVTTVSPHGRRLSIPKFTAARRSTS